MLGELAASGTALAWGAADFCGGRASRRASAQAVVVVSQLASVPLLAIALVLAGTGWPGASAIGWGLLAGLSGGIGLVLFYRALASGAMSVVAPITGVTSASVPVVFGFAIDGLPAVLPLVGVGLAVLAVGLVSAAPGAGRPDLSHVALALAAGVAFGLFLVLLAPVGDDAGLWPLVGVRIGSLVSAGLLCAHGPRTLRLPAPAARFAVAAGALDILANGAYLVAVYNGVLAVVGPIASLYPTCTVLLAIVVDRERPRRPQLAAIGLAAAALVLTHAG